ncbi:uncharacterized protein LOC130678095 [Microplitis mediator]|uniref:uncharacterized protein LOC130678095 n=1 Tax=Microplitis mediator TaxID=375433 RepID=UPI00255713DE|nr:uncharacterized protein LOC130678095 [Microplitis mediator]
MAARMFDFQGLRETLIDQTSTELEWTESEESDCDIFTEFLDHEFMYESTDDSLYSKYSPIKETIPTNNSDYYLGKDKITKWYKVPLKKPDREFLEILKPSTGSHNNASYTNTIIDCWLLFIDDKIFELVVHYTNLFIAKLRPLFKQKQDCNDTNVKEIKSFVGLLVLMGLLKSKNQNCDELWEQCGLGVDVFRLTMSLSRFKFLLRTIHFDDENDRLSRKEIDNLVIIREIFELFVENCQKNYSVGDNITICEFLIEYKGECPSYLHVKEKFSRCGMKIYASIDTNSFYVSNMVIHVKQQLKSTCKDLNDPENIVRYFVTKVQGQSQNIILNTSLSSIPLIKNLYNNNSHITVIGSVDKNDQQIPLEFITKSNKPPNSCMYGFRENMILLSYFSNKNENTILFSTPSNTNDFDEETVDHSSIINSYEKALNAVNKIKQMIHEYSVARRTRRYSLSIWFYMINIACLNSFIVYCSKSNNHISRREFLKQLGLRLVNDSIKDRASDKYLAKQLRENAAQFSSTQPFHPQIYNEVENKAMRCTVCPRKRDIKVRTFCYQCKLPMCKKHMSSVCENCVNSALNVT